MCGLSAASQSRVVLHLHRPLRHLDCNGRIPLLRYWLIFSISFVPLPLSCSCSLALLLTEMSWHIKIDPLVNLYQLWILLFVEAVTTMDFSYTQCLVMNRSLEVSESRDSCGRARDGTDWECGDKEMYFAKWHVSYTPKGEENRVAAVILGSKVFKAAAEGQLDDYAIGLSFVISFLTILYKQIIHRGKSYRCYYDPEDFGDVRWIVRNFYVAVVFSAVRKHQQYNGILILNIFSLAVLLCSLRSPLSLSISAPGNIGPKCSARIHTI